MTKSIIFETERLILSTATENDAKAIFEYRSHPEVSKFQGWNPSSLLEVQNALLNERDIPFNTEDTWYRLIIKNKLTHQVYGEIGLHFCGPENAQLEIGCSLHPDFQGNGYALEAMKYIIKHSFSRLNKHRIFASIDPRNAASENLLKKLLFRKEAHFIKSYLHHGEWVDDVVYALLKEEI